MTTLIVVLSALAFVLPVGSAAAAYLGAHRRRRALLPRLDEALAEMHTPDAEAVGGSRGKRQRAFAILQPTLTYDDAPYLRQIIEVHVLDSEWRSLRWPALVASVGLASGMASSILAAVSASN